MRGKGRRKEEVIRENLGKQTNKERLEDRGKLKRKEKR